MEINKPSSCPAMGKEPQVPNHSKKGSVVPTDGLYVAAKAKVFTPARNRTPVAHSKA